MQHTLRGPSSTLAAFLSTMLLAAVQPAAACVNEDIEEPDSSRKSMPRVLQPGIPAAAELAELLHPPAFDTENWKQVAASFAGKDQAKLSVSDRNSYGVALLYSGQAAQARDVWLRLEAEEPGRYATAANLGTAYELAGDNANALKWIKTGVQRNPDSHDGTEWLHVKILEAKLAMEQDPRWLDSNTVLGLDFGMSAMPAAMAAFGRGNTNQSLQLTDAVTALTYQLKERTKFVRTPEPVVAQLLFDLGNVLLLADAPASAQVAYRRALDYGNQDDVLLNRLDRAAELARVPAATNRPAYLPYAISGAAGIALAGLLILLRLRRSAAGQRQI